MKPWIIFWLILAASGGVIIVSLIWPQAEIRNQNTQEVKSASQEIRKNAVAGAFYPAGKQELENQLVGYLAKAEKKTQGKTRILIVPHAGLEYSGAIAAYGYKQIEGENYDKAIILGASHQQFFNQAAVYSGGEWETPLGTVNINETLAKNILSSEQNIINEPSVHQKEHSLEVEVIWLKKIIPDITIVPILVSQPSEELINALAYRIALNMDENTLLVISTDLSHYPDYQTAVNVDTRTIQGILSGKRTIFEQTAAQLTGEKYPNVQTLACGYEAIRVALKVAELLKLENPQLLKYQNSGDVTDDKNRVVGYGVIGFAAPELAFQTPVLSEEAKKEALEIAKKTLNSYLADNKYAEPTEIKNPILKEPLGAFVTLRKNGELRGCIGEFEPSTPLYNVIRKKTVDAAINDPRFKPVTAGELPQLTLEISVMSPKRRIDNWQAIKLGTDGVMIRQGARSGTFLPQVATETKWGLEEFLGQLCSQKAGLPEDCYKNPATEIFTYQAQVFE